MTKVYKNPEAFLMENFPKSYPEFIKEEETSFQHHVDVLSEQLHKNINKILKGELSSSQNQNSIQDLTC